MKREFVTLPTGITVPRVGVWLHESCPDAATRHSPLPEDFSEAAGGSRTHRQVKCPTCGLFAVWELREKCPFCGGAGCLACRGRGTVGPAFRANRGMK